LPTRNKFIYSDNVEFQRPGIDKLSEGIFNSINSGCWRLSLAESG